MTGFDDHQSKMKEEEEEDVLPLLRQVGDRNSIRRPELLESTTKVEM